MKRTFTLVALFLSVTSFASTVPSNCPQAKPDYDVNFCSSFKSVAECHCLESGLPKGVCQDMNSIYNLMISRFGSIQKACEYQKDTGIEACKDDWNCHLVGGRDSQGKLCSSTGKSC